MSDRAEQLKTAVLALPEADRVELANLLYESLPADPPEGFFDELERRRAEFESGADPGIPAAEFFARLRKGS